MPEFDKIAIIKTAWCDEFQGELAQGAHAQIDEDEESHESYNFKPGPDGNFYAYTPPIGEHSAAPSPKDRKNWLVFAVAKQPGKNGVYLVGWYENAEFTGNYTPRPEYDQSPHGLELDVHGERYTYTLSAPEGFMIPASRRSFSFKGTHTKRAPVYYLRGNGESDAWRDELAAELLAQRTTWINQGPLETAARRNPGGICGDAEKRSEVEKASVAAVIKQMGNHYDCVDRQKDNCGFDLLFVEKRTNRERHIEVKGTQNSVGHFFLSRNEDNRGSSDPAWELALVTDALDDPKVELMTYAEAQKAFEWEVICWHAKRKN